MRRRRPARGSLLALAAIALAPPLGAQAEPQVAPQQVERALAKVYPALVNLTVVTERFGDGRAMRGPGAGSGVVVSAEGHLLTNFHVAGDSTRITATLTTGEVIEADVVVHDPLTDLSVLRLRLAGRRRGAEPLSPARFAERPLAVGDPVMAMGNPLTLSSSVTLGIVSNPRRVFTDFLGNQLEDLDLGNGETTGLFTQWIQHDALILPGNSGGPLVNLEGEVVGINELGGGGMGFAIPAGIAREVLRHALATGRVRRSWLGFTVVPVEKLGRELGALVSSVVPGSPADEAGLRAGDVLLELGSRPVSVRFFAEVPDLYRKVATLPIGEPVTLVVERAGERRTLSASPTEMEQARGREAEFRRLGFTAQEVTGPMALVRQLAPRAGLLVTSLRAGFAAAGAKPPIQVDDLVTAVGDRPVRSIAELAAALEAAPGPEVLLAVRRDEERLLAVARLVEPLSARWGGELPKPWLGVRTQVVTPELGRLLGTPELRGFRVTEVFPWTAAARAQLAVGDVVVALDGETIEGVRVQDAENLERAIEARAIGDEVELEVLRGGAPQRIRLQLEARPDSAEEAHTARQRELEFGVRELTFHDRIERHLDREQGGVVVTEVTPGGWAQMAGLQSADLILELGGRAVGDVAQFEQRMGELLIAQPPVIAVFVRRGWRTHFVFFEPEWSELELPAGGSR